MNVYLYYWKYVHPYRMRFFTVLLIAIPIGMMDGLIAWSVKPFMDSLISGKSSINLGLIPLFVIGFNLVQGGLNYISTYMNGYLSQKITMSIRQEAYNKLQRFNLKRAHQQNSGVIITRFFNDPNRVQMALLANTKTIISRITSTLSIGAAMFFINWKLCFIALLTASLIIVPVSMVRRKITRQSNEENQSSGYLIGMLNSSLMGMKIINSFNLQGEMDKRYAKAQQDVYHRMMSITKAQAALSPLVYLITSIGISAILYYGSHLILSHQMTPGALVAFISALLMLYRPMRSIGDTAVNTQRLLTVLHRVRDILENKSLEDKDTSHLQPVKPLENQIEFRNVYFNYGKDKPWALEDVNLTLPKGKMVALVGRSGSGKTTLAELLMGLYRVSGKRGRIFYDEVNLRKVNLNSLREQIGYVSQDTFLFDGSLKDNLLLGNLSATEAELNAAIEQANLREFVDSLPLGLATEIGERGVQLSGGQRQRLAIARAFIKNAPILILDEATSALDNESEAAVQKALDILMSNRTTLVIAHRLSTIQHADKIVLLDKGQVQEEGTHEELLAHKGLYYHLFQAQFGVKPGEDVLLPSDENSDNPDEEETLALSEECLSPL